MSRQHGVRQILAGSIENVSMRSIGGGYNGLTDDRLAAITTASKVAIKALYASEAGETLSGALGGTGVANTGKTITLGGNLQTIGAYATILRATAGTDITIPTSGTLATTAQLEEVRLGVSSKTACRLVYTAALPACTYNGTTNTLTANALVALPNTDGKTPVTGNRILVNGQADKLNNGVYDVTEVGLVDTTAFILTRAADADGTPENELKGGDHLFITEGTTYGSMGFVCRKGTGTGGAVIIETDEIIFDLFSGVGQMNPVDGLYKTGNDIGISSTGVNAVNNNPVSKGGTGKLISITSNYRGQITSLTDADLTIADIKNSTVSIAELNALDGQGCIAADFAKLHAITVSDEDVNNLLRADMLADAADIAKGAALVGLASGITNLSATTVRGALAEIQGDIDYIFNASLTAARGAALINFQAISNFTATNVRSAIVELFGYVENLWKSDAASNGGTVYYGARAVGCYAPSANYISGSSNVLSALTTLDSALRTAEDKINNTTPYEFVTVTATEVDCILSQKFVAGSCLIFLNGGAMRKDPYGTEPNVDRCCEYDSALKKLRFGQAFLATDEVIVLYKKDMSV